MPLNDCDFRLVKSSRHEDDFAKTLNALDASRVWLDATRCQLDTGTWMGRHERLRRHRLRHFPNRDKSPIS